MTNTFEELREILGIEVINFIQNDKNYGKDLVLTAMRLNEDKVIDDKEFENILCLVTN